MTTLEISVAPSTVRRHIATFANRGLLVPATLFLILLFANLLEQPARFDGLEMLTTLGLGAPLILASVASTPAVLAGGGGLDLSVAPLMGLTNVVIVNTVVAGLGWTSPFLVIPAVLLLGTISGLFNGFLVVGLRLQPIVATLGTALLYGGFTIVVMSRPGGSVPNWLSELSHTWSFVPILSVGVIWVAVTRLPWHTQLLATGGDERAAFSAGVPTELIRWSAYVVTGLFAAVAGLSLTAFLGSGDPSVGATYIVPAITAFALGGISPAGGKGSLFGAALGGLDLFLLQILLTSFNASTFLLDVLFGLILVVVVTTGSIRSRKQKP